jgi:hypothetical protein
VVTMLMRMVVDFRMTATRVADVRTARHSWLGRSSLGLPDLPDVTAVVGGPAHRTKISGQIGNLYLDGVTLGGVKEMKHSPPGGIP